MILSVDGKRICSTAAKANVSDVVWATGPTVLSIADPRTNPFQPAMVVDELKVWNYAKQDFSIQP